MRQLTIILLFSSLCAAQIGGTAGFGGKAGFGGGGAAGGSAPVVVQDSPNTCFSTNTTSVTCAFPSPVVAGHMLLIWIGVSASSTINTPTMTGETFIQITAACENLGAGAGQECLYTTNSAAGGQTSFSCPVTGSADIHCHGIEVSGQAASPQDCVNALRSTTGSIGCTTTNPKDLVVGFFYDNASNTTLTLGGGYTKAQSTNNGTGGDSALSEWLAVSTAGLKTATAGGNGADNLEQGLIAIKGL